MMLTAGMVSERSLSSLEVLTRCNNPMTGFYCILISFLWGATNSLIKKSTKEVTKVKSCDPISGCIAEFEYLATNWKYLFLFIINQAGSVLYFILLQGVDLSLIVPTVNALTFVITGCFGILTGEKAPTLKTLIGVVLILVGISFCVVDKIQDSPVE